MLQRKNGVIASMRKGVSQLVSSRGVEILKGQATIERAGLLKVRTAEGERSIEARSILIATGSEPVGLPFLRYDGKHVVSSTEALSFESVPSRLLVIGGGAIGLEMASIWSRLGSEVTVLEFLPRIAPASDAEVGWHWRSADAPRYPDLDRYPYHRKERGRMGHARRRSRAINPWFFRRTRS